MELANKIVRDLNGIMVVYLITQIVMPEVVRITLKISERDWKAHRKEIIEQVLCEN